MDPELAALLANGSISLPAAAIPNNFLVGLEIILGVLGLTGNCLVIVTVCWSKTLHSLTNYLILNLAIADGLMSLCSILNPWFIWAKYSSDELPLCFTGDVIDDYLEVQIYSIFQRALADSSPLCLLLLTVERFVGIVYSLHHFNFFCVRRLVTFLAITWTLPFLMELPAGLWFIIKYKNNYCYPSNAQDEPWITAIPIISSTITVLIPAIAMTLMYAKITHNLQQNARSLESQGIHGPPQELLRARLKIVNTLIVVTAAFILLILPCRIIYITTVANLVYTEPHPVIQQQIVVILGVLNSAINPVFYGFKYDKFRRALVAMVCRRGGRTGNDVAPHRVEINTTQATQSTVAGP